MAASKLRLISYNCRGWNNGYNYLNDFADSFDICLIQEHWLFNAQLSRLNLSGCLSCGVSGMEDGSLLLGRPYGGCGIIFNKSLLKHVKALKLPFNKFCAITLNLNDKVTLIISVYLPTNYRTSSSDDDFLVTLGEISGFISSQTYDNIIIGGDFNTDFDKPTSRSSLLDSFMEEHNLVAVDTSFRDLIGHTYERDDGYSTS